MRQRKVSQSHWKEELRSVNSHWGERAVWKRALEPGLVQGPGCSCPPVHRGMAEWPIRTATLKPLYVSRSDDKLDLQGVVCFFFLALCVTFNGPQRDKLTLDWRIYSLLPGPIPICLGWHDWKGETQASHPREVNFKGPPSLWQHWKGV